MRRRYSLKIQSGRGIVYHSVSSEINLKQTNINKKTKSDFLDFKLHCSQCLLFYAPEEHDSESVLFLVTSVILPGYLLFRLKKNEDSESFFHVWIEISKLYYLQGDVLFLHLLERNVKMAIMPFYDCIQLKLIRTNILAVFSFFNKDNSFVNKIIFSYSFRGNCAMSFEILNMCANIIFWIINKINEQPSVVRKDLMFH